MSTKNRIEISFSREAAMLVLNCVQVVQSVLETKVLTSKKKQIAKAKLKIQIAAIRENGKSADQGSRFWDRETIEILQGDPTYRLILRDMAQIKNDTWVFESVKKQLLHQLEKEATVCAQE